MYQPSHFKEEHPERLQALIKAQPLGALVRVVEGQPEVDHLPFYLHQDEAGKLWLHAHVARANPLWQQPEGEVLVIFQGPSAYISPSWYPGKASDPRVVPTWNYSVVHAHGRLKVVDDAIWLRQLVDKLTTEHEARVDGDWTLAQAPAGFAQTLLTHIVGIEIELTALQGKFKLSQNRSPRDRQGLLEGLRARGDAAQLAVAEAMDALLPPH